MSLYTRRAPCFLQKATDERTASGGTKRGWQTVTELEVAITETSSYINSTNAVYAKTTHTALVYSPMAEVEKGLYRILQGQDVYHVLQVTTAGRKTMLLLEKVSDQV